jgi:serralysin
LNNVAGQFQSLDASFGSGGKLLLSTVPAIDALAIQPDGKIIGGSHGLLRLNPDGTLDPGFGIGGKVDTGRVTALALTIQSDGKILAGGRIDLQADTSSKTTFALLRLMPDGTPDQDFGA